MAVEDDIREIIDRETRAWDTKNVDLLVSVFHPDMVWPWPAAPRDHDPVTWILSQGRYNRERWAANWKKLFDTYALVHNRRSIVKIVVSAEGDGAFAVVDVDTLWRDRQGNESHWCGRACKIYAKVHDAWLMTMQTGLLDYSGFSGAK